MPSNKLETKKYLKSLGINNPDEITFKSLRKKNYTKAVYKPIDGAGTTDTYIIENEKNIINTLSKKRSCFFLEEWVEERHIAYPLIVNFQILRSYLLTNSHNFKSSRKTLLRRCQTCRKQDV